MKKFFLEPETEVIKFETDDICTASATEENVVDPDVDEEFPEGWE